MNFKQICLTHLLPEERMIPIYILPYTCDFILLLAVCFYLIITVVVFIYVLYGLNEDYAKLNRHPEMNGLKLWSL